MKLKNKKTGETGFYLHTHRDFTNGHIKVAVLKDGEPFSEFKPHEPIYDYDSLAELNKDWEDYIDAPDEVYFISNNGQVHEEDGRDRYRKERQAIDNYFKTKGEAELAVRKLKAWKRLKDKGFRFDGRDDRDRGQLGDIVIYAGMPTFEYDNDSTRDDLDLLFGGEE